MNLGGATRTFTVADGPPAIDLVAANDITNGNLVKASDGTLALNGALGTGASTLSADAGTTILGASQTLAALTIAGGATVVLEENSLPSPTLADANSAVPEPGIGALLLSALALLGLRRPKERFPSAGPQPARASATHSPTAGKIWRCARGGASG